MDYWLPHNPDWLYRVAQGATFPARTGGGIAPLVEGIVEAVVTGDGAKKKEAVDDTMDAFRDVFENWITDGPGWLTPFVGSPGFSLIPEPGGPEAPWSGPGDGIDDREPWGSEDETHGDPGRGGHGAPVMGGSRRPGSNGPVVTPGLGGDRRRDGPFKSDRPSRQQQPGGGPDRGGRGTVPYFPNGSEEHGQHGPDRGPRDAGAGSDGLGGGTLGPREPHSPRSGGEGDSQDDRPRVGHTTMNSDGASAPGFPPDDPEQPEDRGGGSQDDGKTPDKPQNGGGNDDQSEDQSTDKNDDNSDDNGSEDDSSDTDDGKTDKQSGGGKDSKDSKDTKKDEGLAPDDGSGGGNSDDCGARRPQRSRDTRSGLEQMGVRNGNALKSPLPSESGPEDSEKPRPRPSGNSAKPRDPDGIPRGNDLPGDVGGPGGEPVGGGPSRFWWWQWGTRAQPRQ